LPSFAKQGNRFLQGQRAKRSSWIPLADIALIRRGRKDLKDIAELARDIELNGQINPITIRKPNPSELAEAGKRPWVLVAGGRRYAATASLGRDTIWCVLLEDMPEWQQRLVELSENLQRQDLSFDEVCDMKAEIHTLYTAAATTQGKTWTQKDTAYAIGETPANLSRDLKLSAAMQQDPTLRQATSKKAAVRAVEMRQYVAQMEAANKINTTGLRERIVTARAQEWLKQFPDESVDLILTDPPFGLGDTYEQSREDLGGLSLYDDSLEAALCTIRETVPLMLRVTKPTGWLVLKMNWNCYTQLKEAIECCCTVHWKYGTPVVGFDKHGFSTVTLPDRCESYATDSRCNFVRTEPLPWIWHRPNSRNNPSFPELHAQNQYELLTIVNRGEARLVMSAVRRVPNVRVHDAEYSDRIHSMEVPLSFAADLVEEFSLAGQLVIDPFCGSGKFVMGAAMLGREFRACDQNPNIYENIIANIAPHWQGARVVSTDSAGAGTVQLEPTAMEK
jgi:ParB/RepB/Spo0J family partition protein